MADGSRTKLGIALEEERARILTAFAGIGLTDAEETFTLANAALEEMLGFGPGALVGISLASVTSGKEFDWYRAFTRKRRQGCWNRPRVVRSFSTKSPICRWTCRSSCYGSCRSAGSGVWVDKRTSMWISAWSVRRTRVSKRR